MTPHPEQAPSLLDRVTDKSFPPDNVMIVNDPASDATGPSTWPITVVDNMTVLLYNDELDLLL